MSQIHSSISKGNITVKNFSLRYSPQGDWIYWPEWMSYLAWQNLLQSFLNRAYSLSSKKQGVHRKRKSQKKNSKCSQINSTGFLKDFVETLERKEDDDNSEDPHEVDKCEIIKEDQLSLELISLLKKFIEKKGINEHIEKEIKDSRDPEAVTYSKQSILLGALSIFLFRLGSGNKYEEKSRKLKGKYSKTNIAQFIDAHEDSVPAIKTIEDFLKTQDEESMNRLMIAFFKELIESKFFTSHPEIMPGDFFLLAADCVHTHTYEHPHHTDEEGNLDCPYCLKRVYNKSTDKEKVIWMHCTLIYSLVFLGHLKIPIYYYPIHAKQISGQENSSDNIFKQECEIVALKKTLPKIKDIFGRKHIVMLLDGLYANRPVIRLVNSLDFGYIIVRKEGNLSTLGKDCDGLSKLANHKKNHTKTTTRIIKHWMIKHEYEYFNCMDIGDKDGELKTNILRFKETREKIVKKTVKREEYYCEWLFSWKLSLKNCVFASCLARLRWEEEDIFNTLKNRDFKFKHDYSRDPRSFFNWQGLSLLAFGIFEIFRFSEAVKQKRTISRIALAEVLQAQLYERATEDLFSDLIKCKKVQFRYCFNTEQRFYDKDEWTSDLWQKTG